MNLEESKYLDEALTVLEMFRDDNNNNNNNLFLLALQIVQIEPR